MPTFAEERVARLETLPRENVGGQSVAYANPLQRYECRKAEAAKSTEKRPFIRSPGMMEGP